MIQLQLSARADHHILKLARTIADLAGKKNIRSTHLAEELHAARSPDGNDGIVFKDTN